MPKRRGYNYTEEEKNVLISIIQKYKQYVLNRQADQTSRKIKRAYWKIIAEEYNNKVTCRPREVKQLKECYHNIFKRHRAIQIKENPNISVAQTPQIYVDVTRSEHNNEQETDVTQEWLDNSDMSTMENNSMQNEFLPPASNETSSAFSETRTAYSSAIRKGKFKHKLLQHIGALKSMSTTIGKHFEEKTKLLIQKQEVYKKKLKLLDMEIHQRVQEYAKKQTILELEIKIKESMLQSL